MVNCQQQVPFCMYTIHKQQSPVELHPISSSLERTSGILIIPNFPTTDGSKVSEADVAIMSNSNSISTQI